MYESEYTAHAWMQQEKLKLKLKLSGFEQYVIKIGLDVMDSKTYVAQCILLNSGLSGPGRYNFDKVLVSSVALVKHNFGLLWKSLGVFHQDQKCGCFAYYFLVGRLMGALRRGLNE